MLSPVAIAAMENIDPPASDELFYEVRASFKNQSPGNRVSRVRGILDPGYLAAKFMRPYIFTAVSIAGIVNAERVIRNVFEKKLLPTSKPTPSP
jgi:hypothetical protein